LLFSLYFFEKSNALDNGLALTPPMGWMAWQRFRCITNCTEYPDECINDKLFETMSDALVSEGFKDAGYNHVHIDDCYLADKRLNGNEVTADSARFPKGLTALGDYIHSKGLKFAVYEDIGTLTCAGYPGSRDFLQQDAKTFASWGADYLKLDGCYSTKEEFAKNYPLMSTYLNQTGRPMIYSCSWPAYLTDAEKKEIYPILQKNCNLWRQYDDIQDSYNSLITVINYWGDMQGDFAQFAGPGSWNDPDMLIIGNFGLSEDQSRLQMAIWSIVAAPLLMGNDVRSLQQWQKDILLNREVIAVNQDKLGKQGLRITAKGNFEVWKRELANGDIAVVLLNKCDGCGVAQWMNASWSQLGLSGSYYVRDLFAHSDLGQITGNLRLKVNESGVRMVRISKEKYVPIKFLIQ